MSIVEGFSAVCHDCEAEYHNSVVDPTRRRENSEIANRDIWAQAHYDKTGHHSFRMARISERTVSVARIHDPNQLRLADDPDNAHLDPANWKMRTDES